MSKSEDYGGEEGAGASEGAAEEEAVDAAEKGSRGCPRV